MPRGVKSKDDLTYDKANGYWTLNIGKKLKVDGKLSPMKFYLDSDQDKSLIKKAYIVAEWLKIKNAGGTFWTEEALHNLETQGVIRPRKPMIRRDDALAMFKDPLSDAELKQFTDEKGMRAETAPAALDYTARKFIARTDIRAMIHDEWMKAVKAGRGWALIKELCSTFGWTHAQANALLFNVHGNMAVSPIGYDATTGRGKPEAIEAIADIYDAGTPEGAGDE